MIMSMDNAKLDRIKMKWEKEIGTEISEDILTEALKKVHNSRPTSCERLSIRAKLQFKVVPGLHWSRAKNASFYPNVDGSCIRCHVNVANLTHMFGSCHLLTG